MATILVVDDEPLICDHCCTLLERAGYIAVAATSGRDALNILDSDALKVDLILLDMTMPNMDGNTFIECLRARGEHAPVILLTAWIDKLRAELKGSVSGAVLKPFNEKELLAVVAEALGGKS